MQPDWVYLNGAHVSRAEARISPDDRGFVFADGVYEVVRAYKGRWFRMAEHLRRLRRSLAEARIDLPDPSFVEPTADELLARNGLAGSDATVYVQITRGAAPRAHAFPVPPVAPTVFMCVAAARDYAEARSRGLAVVTTPDVRWLRCDIKSIGLMPNVLALQSAHEQAAAEAVFVRDGRVTEGTHTNVFGVLNGRVMTHPANSLILSGITRAVVLACCRDEGIPAIEEPIAVAEVAGLEEAFLTATSFEVAPIVSIDGHPVGSGRPGPLTRRLQDAFASEVRTQCGP